MRSIATTPPSQLHSALVLQKFLLASALALLISGCATPPPPTSGPQPPQPLSVSETAYKVATLDRAELIYADGRRESLEVSQDGAIDPGGGPIRVRGMSRGEFVSLLRRKIPGATSIEIVEFRMDEISVLGEVFHQIRTTMGGGPMRVMDGIAAANGFTPLANKRRVKLVRQNAGTVTVYELDLREMLRGSGIEQNMLLQPGDVITVPRNFL